MQAACLALGPPGQQWLWPAIAHDTHYACRGAHRMQNAMCASARGGGLLCWLERAFTLQERLVLAPWRDRMIWSVKQAHVPSVMSVLVCPRACTQSSAIVRVRTCTHCIRKDPADTMQTCCKTLCRHVTARCRGPVKLLQQDRRHHYLHCAALGQ